MIQAKRLGTILYYTGVISEYFIVILIAIWLNNFLKVPSLFNLVIKTIGFILALFGVILICWSSWLQFTVGRGTTGVFETTQELVTTGPYAIIRNPMMVGQFLVFAGLGFYLDLGIMFLILPLLILGTHLFTVYIEEPNLKRRFDQKWIDYTKIVPRWLLKLPFLKK